MEPLEAQGHVICSTGHVPRKSASQGLLTFVASLLVALVLVVFFAVPLMACPNGCGEPLFGRWECSGIPDFTRRFSLSQSCWRISMRCPRCHERWIDVWRNSRVQ